MSHVFGIPIITSEFLTVPGEPVEVPAPDWRERMERNGRRALAHLYSGVDIDPPSGRRCKKHEGFEPLDIWVTPQVPDPNVHVMQHEGRTYYLCHPEIEWRLRKTLESASTRLRDEIDRMTFDAMVYGVVR